MELEKLRNQLDGIDRQILVLFLKRMEVIEQVAVWKKENDYPVLDSKRENEKIQDVVAQSPDELSEYTKDLFATIMELSRRRQEQISHHIG